jgi:hypothetical protein
MERTYFFFGRDPDPGPPGGAFGAPFTAFGGILEMSQ